VSTPKILLLGAGGIGGYFGGRLAESGADVTFLVREGRRKTLSEQGLRIESPLGDAQLAVTTVVASDVTPVYDVVILTCKAYDLDTAVAAIAPAVSPSGYVLPLLNGITHIDILNPELRIFNPRSRQTAQSVNSTTGGRSPLASSLAR
jgi:2-dehydropantoate 2-reductase